MVTVKVVFFHHRCSAKAARVQRQNGELQSTSWIHVVCKRDMKDGGVKRYGKNKNGVRDKLQKGAEAVG